MGPLLLECDFVGRDGVVAIRYIQGEPTAKILDRVYYFLCFIAEMFAFDQVEKYSYEIHERINHNCNQDNSIFGGHYDVTWKVAFDGCHNEFRNT